MAQKKIRIGVLAGLLVVLAASAWLATSIRNARAESPVKGAVPVRNLSAEDAAYFRALDAELKAHGYGRPVVVLDLDRLDHNIDTLVRHMGGAFQFRVVDKSLPSSPLLNYILNRAGTRAVMAFHTPFLPELLTELPQDTDILFGKTIPVAAAREAIAQLPAESRAQMLARVHWLIDTPETLTEYLSLYQELGLTLNANIEIDVGLHRGGAQCVAELEAVLDAIRAFAPRVTLTGLMGYDGHVSHVPVIDIFGWKKAAMQGELSNVQKKYAAFVQDIQSRYPELYATMRTFNSGGSDTYEMYRPGTVINDLSVGSALLKPSDYDIFTLDDHVNAAFIAAPLLKRIQPVEIPFIGRISLNGNDDSYFVYGGGWANNPVYPSSIHTHPLMSGSPMLNLVSNQSFLWGDVSNEVPGLAPGDFVFYRPLESDAIFGFEDILTIRNGKIVGDWHPFAKRY